MRRRLLIRERDALVSSATLAESPIDILLWNFPLKSHLRMLLQLSANLSNSAPPRSRAARHATIDHQFRAGHVAGGVRGEEKNPVRDVLRLPGPAERYTGFGHLVRINWCIAPAGPRQLRPNRRVDDPGMDGVDPYPIGFYRAFHRNRLSEQAHTSLRRAITGQPCRPAKTGG